MITKNLDGFDANSDRCLGVNEFCGIIRLFDVKIVGSICRRIEKLL